VQKGWWKSPWVPGRRGKGKRPKKISRDAKEGGIVRTGKKVLKRGKYLKVRGKTHAKNARCNRKRGLIPQLPRDKEIKTLNLDLYWGCREGTKKRNRLGILMY